jgi:hypothetical protein
MKSPSESNQSVGAGTILIEKDTLLPVTLGLENGVTGNGWSRMTTNPNRHQLEDKLSAAGWRFFLMAGAMRSFLGLHSVGLSAHSRHIQNGIVCAGHAIPIK